MTEEDKSEVTVEIMNDYSRIVGKSYGELDPKLQDEGYGGGSNDEEEENEKNQLGCSAIAHHFSKDRWTEILEEVQPIPSILLYKFPTMTLRYKLIISRFEATIRDLPFSQDLLPMHIKLCKSTIKILQKQKKKNLWENYTNSVPLDQLENSLKLLFSLMISIAIELKVDSDIVRIEARYAIKQDTKLTDKSIHVPVDKEKNEDNKNKLKTNDGKVDESTNRWIEILEEVQPIDPILLKKFPRLCGQYKFIFEQIKKVIRNLPFSRHQLPSMARICRRNYKYFQKEKKNGLWNDFANISVELEKLENTLIFLFSKVVSIAFELKIDLVRKTIDYKRLVARNESYVTNRKKRKTTHEKFWMNYDSKNKKKSAY